MNKQNMGVKLIPDREINLLENDILGTSVYVEAIRKIIENSGIVTPCTIGIFGSWGSGKTSIIKTLKEIYEKENKRIKVFIYDAWKYSKDDFRRSFLIELADFLKKENIKNELEKRFYTIESQRTMFGISKFINLQRETSKQTPNLIFPEKFSEYFNKLIDSLSDNHKLVIAIDNIDRCHKEQAFEILLTVKTFLGHEKVIFIIPVDDKGLKSYLQMSNKDANEFLRKIFNVSITIKSFSSNELYDFAVKLWDKYEINLPKKETVISLICQEFSKNPRRIIQFLNTLQVEYNLALLQEEKRLIPEGSITNNIEMLVKLLIIREEYPTLYEKIIDDKSLLQTITDDIRVGKFTKDNRKQLWENGTIELTEEEYRFFMRTSNIVLDESRLEPFFLLKDIFKDIPDEVENFVISQDWEAIKRYIESGQITLERLLNFIETKIDEDVIKRNLYDTTGFNLLSLILKIIAEKKEEIETLPDKIISCLSISELWKNTFNYPPKELAISLKWLKDKQIIEPLNYVIETINRIDVENLTKDRKPIEFLKEFVTAFKNDSDTLSEIKRKFSEILSKNFSFYNDFKDIESEAIKYLLDNNFVKQIIPTLSQDFNQNQTKEKVEIITILYKYDVLDNENITNFVIRCINNAGILRNYQNWHIFNFWIKAVIDFIGKVEDTNLLTNLFNSLNQNYNYLFQTYVNIQPQQMQIETYESFIKLLGEFYLSTNNTQYKQNVVTWLNNFLNYPIHINVYSAVNEVYRKLIKETDDWQSFAQNIVNQLFNQSDWEFKKITIETVNLMLSKTRENSGLTQQQITSILQHYLVSYINTNNNELKKYIIKISKNELIRKKIIELITENYITPEAVDKMLPIINELIDKYGFDRFYPKVRELLASTNSKEQESGVKLLDIVKEKIPDDKKPTIKQLLSEIDSKKTF